MMPATSNMPKTSMTNDAETTKTAAAQLLTNGNNPLGAVVLSPASAPIASIFW